MASRGMRGGYPHCLAALVVMRLIWETITEYRITIEGVQHFQVAFIEMCDIFLFGTVLGG